MSELEIQNPGEMLKSSREKLGLTINDVSLATKINPRILKALEEGTRDQLPPKSFTRGFIRSYANYLKIDSKPILDGYDLGDPAAITSTVNTNPSEINANATAADNAPKTSVSTADHSITSKALIGSGIVVLLVLIFGIKKIVDKYSAEATIPVTPIEHINSDANSTAAQDAMPAPLAESEAPVAQNEVTESNDKKVTAAEVKATADAKPAAGVQSPDKPVETKPTEQKVAETKTQETKPIEVKVAETKPIEAKLKESSPQEIIIEALDKVEIRAKIDDGDWKTIQLAPEGVHTIKAKNFVSLEISDGGMVNIVQNGADRGAAGDLGKPAKIKYP